MDEALKNFYARDTTHRIMTLKTFKNQHVHLPAFEVWSTIAIAPKVRRGLFRLLELHPDALVGDIESLRENTPLVYKYVYRTDRNGKRLQGRPRKLVVEEE